MAKGLCSWVFLILRRSELQLRHTLWASIGLQPLRKIRSPRQTTPAPLALHTRPPPPSFRAESAERGILFRLFPALGSLCIRNAFSLPAGGAALTSQSEFGWPIVAGLVHARVGLGFSFSLSSAYQFRN